MGGIRNPFLFRATEQNNEDDLFIQLFSEDILNILHNNISDIFIKPLILRSSPGFGKTSLLKLFTAPILNKLINHNSSSLDKNKLFKAVQDLDFIDKKNRIKKVGVYIPCTNLYTNLQDIEDDEKGKGTLFFALLNSKIIFEFVQTLKLVFNESQKANNSELIKIYIDNKSNIPIHFKEEYEKDCYTLKDFYNYAISVEKEILNYVDNFGLVDYDQSIKLSNLELYSLNILSNSRIEYNNKKVELDFVIMFDDLHKLAEEQRDLIYKTILNDRYNIPIWIAERLSILKDNTIFHGTTSKRDYINIHLENAISERSNKKLFSNFLLNITNYRMKFSKNNITSFENKLSSNHDIHSIENSIVKLKGDLNRKYSDIIKYKQLIEEVNNFDNYDFSALTKIISMSIFIERKRLEKQQTFDFAEIEASEFLSKYEYLKPAAEYFTMLFYKLPHYYTFEKVTKLASFNTEQFLSIASNLYEEMIARNIINDDEPLSPKLQEEIIKEYADNKWNEIVTTIPNGDKIQNFLLKLLEYSLNESKRTNAPYSPGVTGFAIVNSELKKLQNEKKYVELKNILMVCISYNLLTIKENKKQGAINSEPVTLFYFNRWLCVKYNLPIGYGGWKKKKISDLNKTITPYNSTGQFGIFEEQR